MRLFVDFPACSIAELPAALEGLPKPQRRGYMASIDEEEATVHIVLLESSVLSSTDVAGQENITVKLDKKNVEQETYLKKMKRRAPQCNAIMTQKLPCQNHTLCTLPDSRPRCYCHMSPDIEDSQGKPATS